MSIRVRLVILLFGLLPFAGHAQGINLSSEPVQFLKDLMKVVGNQPNPALNAQIKGFESGFSGSVGPEAQKEFITLAQMLSKKGFKGPEFVNLLRLYGTLITKENFSNEQLSSFTVFLRKSAEANIPKKNIELVAALNDFFSNRLIYNSPFNKLYALNAKYEFRYLDKKQDFFNKETPQETQKPATEEKEEDYGWSEDLNKKEEEYDPWNDASLEVKPLQSGGVRTVSLPSISGIVTVFSQVDLIFVTPSDSVVIQQTSGALDWSGQLFVGEKGVTDWANVSIPTAKATFDKYSFKTPTPRIVAEDVTFEYPDKLKAPVKGVIEIKLEKRPKGQVSTFPRFKSFHNDAVLSVYNEYFDYKGGFSLVGTRMFSTSVYDDYSRITTNKNIPHAFTVEGRRFEFGDTLVTSDRVSFVTLIDKDSISHPAVRMRYDFINKKLKLNKIEKGGYRNSFYSDTFHQVDIKCDAMSWDLTSGKMDFYIVSGKSEIPANFESFNYYNPDRLRYLSTASGYNPLILAGNVVNRKKVNSLTIDEMQAITKKERSIVSNGMLIGHQMGFFDYNPHLNTYSISRKGFHYFKSSQGQTDYDDLVLSSLNKNATDQGNASIDLTSKSLDIKGTQEFKLSDSLGIQFQPKDQSMQIIGNKVFTFNGQIIVKNYRFVGDFEVDYEKFLVKLKRIDSISYIPLAIFKKGGKKEIGGNIKYGTTGLLYLNSPDNKSGRKKLAHFPKLEIKEGALVHFNEPGRRQKFENEVYFKVPSIDIDSLNTKDLELKGTFYSAGIFNPINETLRLMPDTSMGIRHKATVPYKLYGGNSTVKLDSALVLTKRGLKTSGEITHLASKLKATEINFWTDSLYAKGETGKITETTGAAAYFPNVAITEFNLGWIPKADSMKISSKKGFNFYAGTTVLNGALIVRSGGLFGSGNLDRTDSEASSESFKFNKTGFLAENAGFKIKSGEKESRPVLTGKNVSIDFNITGSIAKISPQNADFNEVVKSELEFPFASYKTTIDKATWDIKGKKISMAGNVENSLFTATNPNQYGLKFNGSTAMYDIVAMSLNIGGVPSINSVDASVIPGDGKVSVKKDGMLEPFTKAKIIADTLNGYHVLTNANVKINSRLSFSGSADYQFVNVSADTFNIKLGNFEFAEISKDGNILENKTSGKLSTIARARVTEKDKVYLSPKMLYRGEITMMAPFKNLNLEGAIMPDLKKYPMLGGNWVNYSGNKSEEISINIDNTLKDGGKPLFVGLHMGVAVQTNAMYPTFLSAKKFEDDHDIFLASGVLKRDEPNKKFVVTPQNIKPETDIVNRYELFDDEGVIAMEGKFNLLGGEQNKYLETVGIANLALDSMKYNFSTMMRFNFPIPMPVTLKIGENIVKANLEVGNSESAIVADSPYFMSKLAQYVGQKGAEDYRNKTMKEHLPLFKYSPKFYSSILFSDLNLKWNPVMNSFYSYGKIGISNIGETDINAMVDGYVEVIKSPLTGDEVYVFLEISPEKWYYFGVKNGELGIMSSDDAVNQMLNSDTKKDKKSDVVLVEADEAVKFRKRFLQTYLGIKETQLAKKQSDPTKLVEVPKPGVKKETKKEAEKEGF